MKLTLIRKDKKQQTHVTQKPMESLMERITADTKAEDVQQLRRFLASTADKAFLNIHTEKLHRIYPSAELEKDGNGNLVMRRMNGIVMLSVRNVLGQEAQQRVKLLVGNMPTTLAAFTGSSHRLPHCRPAPACCRTPREARCQSPVAARLRPVYGV